MTTLDDLDTIAARDGGCDRACDDHDSNLAVCAIYGCAAQQGAVDLEQLATMLQGAERLAQRLGLPRSVSGRFKEAGDVVPRLAGARQR